MSGSSRVITRDDLFKFHWLQDARFSPDGQKVVYVVSHILPEDKDKGRKEAKEYSALYLLDLETGNTKKITAGKSNDTNPVFSPDGKTIAFVRVANDDKPQIYLMPIDGGEPEALTEMKQGATSPVWSPDGTRIAFTAGIDWGENKPDRAKSPYRVKRNIWRFDAIGDLDLAVRNLYVIDVATKDVKQLTNSPTIDTSHKWSPDGETIVFNAMMHPDTFKAFFFTLHTVDMDGNVRDILPRDWGSTGEAFFEPSGDSILFVGRPDDGQPIGTHSDLYRVQLSDGALTNLTPDMELAIGGGLEGRIPVVAPFRMLITPDGQAAYHRIQKGGELGIYRIALTGDPEVTPVITGERACVPLDMHSDKLLFMADDINRPIDLYMANTDGTNERQLTDLNAELMADVAPLKVEHLAIKGTDGADVEGWFVHPNTPDAQAPYPTILWIHGGPHGAQGHRFAFDTWVFAGAGYGVMFVNHRASTGYGNAFSTAIKGDWGNLDYNDLMCGVDLAIEKGLADPDKLGVCGISGGGNLSTWIIGNTGRFKAAVPQNPVTNWVSFYGVSDIGVWFSVEQLGGHPHEIPEIYARCSPITYAHKCTTPTLMIQNEHDWRCPPEQSEQFYTVLRANGCTVEMLRHPASAHGGSIRGSLPVRQSHIEASLNWFNQYILGIEPPSETDQPEEKTASQSAD